METIECRSLNELDQTAKSILALAGDEKIWIFQGDLGAGKTTLIQGIAKQFEVVDRVASPTFSLVNEYQNRSGEVFFHFDFYRLEDPSEAIEIGVDEYFESGCYCWIEWAEKIPGFIPEDFLLVKIAATANGSRVLNIGKVINGQLDG